MNGLLIGIAALILSSGPIQAQCRISDELNQSFEILKKLRDDPAATRRTITDRRWDVFRLLERDLFHCRRESRKDADNTALRETIAALEYMSREIGSNDRFDPASYIRVYEETPDKRILLYNPGAPTPESTLLRVDADSKIVLEIDEEQLGPDLALNELFITARLNRGDQNAAAVNVEVLNYSEVAKDPATLASQAGVALRTASGVMDVMSNLVYTTHDLVNSFWGPECAKPVTEQKPRCTYSRVPSPAPIEDRLRLYRPEIESIASFFTSERNSMVVDVIGSDVFGMDLASVKAVAGKFREQATVLLDPASTKPQKEVAERDLLARLQLIWEDLQELRAEIGSPPEPTQYFRYRWTTVVLPRFRQMLVPGTIDLSKYKATDGENLVVTVQARGPGGEGRGGVSREFRFAVKHLRTRVSLTPTAFYLRRFADVTDADGTLRRVNFVPAPGVTFGPTFFYRGLRRDKESAELRPSSPGPTLLSALSPGVGLNVSFMNFTDRDFDPTVRNASGQVVGGFRTTTSTSVQVGTGVVFSLFNSALQGTIGWNLNVAENRMYWGIGFGFLRIGEQIASFVKK